MKISEVLENFEKIVVLTGAGVSKPSGIPTFQNLDNSWPFEHSRAEVLSKPFFDQEPEKFWKIFKELWEEKFLAEPNWLHYFFSDLEKIHEVLIATQNIDGLHLKTGSKKVIEIHGKMRESICLNCKKIYETNFDFNEIPKCDSCERILKPNVSLFMEGITGFSDIQQKIREENILLIVAGCSLRVGPVNELPFYLLGDKGSKSLWMNELSAPPDYDFDYESVFDFEKFDKEKLLNFEVKENNIEELSFEELLEKFS